MTANDRNTGETDVWISSESEEIKKELLKEQKKRKKYGGELSNIQQVWLNVIDEPVHNIEIINENIRVLKLSLIKEV